MWLSHARITEGAYRSAIFTNPYELGYLRYYKRPILAKDSSGGGREIGKEAGAGMWMWVWGGEAVAE